jgi:dTDP-4-amino-4,6-dideoxygalactose transaminase
MRKIQKLIVNGTCTIHHALRCLDETGEGLLLLVDEAGRLARTVTDGDIRRMLLHNAKLDDSLASLPSVEPKVIRADVDESDALRLMNAFLINHVPVVDSDGRPVAIILRHEVDAKILLSTPHLGEYEMGFVEEAFRTNWIAPLGPNVDAFERELADYVGIGHAAAVSSGTAALHLALRVLGVGSGDTIFCSSLTFVASANPILYVHATPVFIDSEPMTWNMSPQALARAMNDAAARGQLPKAVIVVCLYGQSADMDPLVAICNKYHVPIIEDAAESLGATYKNRPSGIMGRIGVYSFNGNKIITTSGGGMLVSNDQALVEKARFLSTQARESSSWYEHAEVGYNYRMSNILAGIGRGQLKVLKQRVAARRAVFERYRQGLEHLTALKWMPEAEFGQSTRWLSVGTIDHSLTDITSAFLIGTLAKSGIEARHVWKPLHRQPLFKGCVYYAHDAEKSFSDDVFKSGVCLPSGSNMSEDQQMRIIRAVDKLFSCVENGTSPLAT